MGHYPAGSDQSVVNMAPSDYVAWALVELSLKKESLGRAFHLCNPKSLPLSEVLGYVTSFGVPLKPLSYIDWVRLLKQDKSNVLWPLSSSFRESEDGTLLGQDVVYSCAECLRELTQVSSDQYAITPEVFHRYLEFYRKIGFVPLAIKTI